MMSLERKGYFRWIGRSPGWWIASEPTRQMGFSEADNKGVSGLYLLKEHSLYLPSNCELLDSAYISTTFASSAVSQTGF